MNRKELIDFIRKGLDDGVIDVTPDGTADWPTNKLAIAWIPIGGSGNRTR